MTTGLQQSTKDRYQDVITDLCKEYGISNRLAAPRIQKITLSMGVGRAVGDGQILNVLADHMTAIAGQKAQLTKAKKSVAQFRSRAGMKIGCMVTLRGDRMWAFLEKLIHVAMPRIRDFRGISPKKGFDKQGNFSLGLTEQALFPEVVLEKVEHNQGLNITITIANTDAAKTFTLMKALGMPFRE